MIIGLGLLIAVQAFAQGVRPTTRATMGPATNPATKPAAAIQKFLRFEAVGAGGKLQSPIITYRNAAGVSVDLIPAIHLGDKAYFHALNDRFKAYDALLYEMVKPKGVSPADVIKARKQPGNDAAVPMVSMIQQMLGEMLDLSFQLDEVDYSPANFVHADLDAETFAQMQEQKGEDMFGLILQQAMAQMAKGDAGPGDGMDFGALMAAMQSPDGGRMLKLTLAKNLNQLDALLGGMDVLKGSVILSERNRVALSTLRKNIESGKKRIGLFYGAAHMSEIEKDLVEIMGLKPTGQVEWITAWDLTAPTTQPAPEQPAPPRTEPVQQAQP